MTKLDGVVRREVTGEDGKQYIITLTADGIMMREKGRRTAFGPLSYSYLHTHAAIKTVNAQRAASTAPRKRKVSRSLISF